MEGKVLVEELLREAIKDELTKFRIQHNIVDIAAKKQQDEERKRAEMIIKCIKDLENLNHGE